MIDFARMTINTDNPVCLGVGFVLGLLTVLVLVKPGMHFFSGRFKALSNRALYEKSRQFMDMTQSHFSGYVREAHQDFKVKEEAFTRAVDPVHRMPDRYEQLLLYMLLILILAGTLGCGDRKKVEPPRENPLVRVAESDLPEFTDTLFLQDLRVAIDQSLVYFKRVPATRTYDYGRDVYNASHMISSLETFKAFLETKPSAKDLNRFIRETYTVYKSIGGSNKDVLFTGYFEPTYPGSRTPGPEYPWPVYSMPDDLFQIDLSAFSDAYKGHKRLMARVDPKSRRVRPYYTREQINNQLDFAQKAQPVVWLANRIDRFFLEIQGSGRVALADGEIARLHYAGVNGRKYSAVGKYLIDKNEVPKEKMSMQAIRKWLTAHPDRMDEVLFTNDSFVFFKEGNGGPFGNINVAVTPVRSIATDTKLFPKGGLAFIQAALPASIGQPKEAWPRASLFVLNQDTGGAIKGPGRVDLFCGAGDWADYTAGHMVARGQLYFLVLTPTN